MSNLTEGEDRSPSARTAIPGRSWRTSATVVVVLLALLTSGGRAVAHPGAITPQAPVGEETTVAFGSTADEGDLATIVVTLPTGFTLARVVIGGGWRAVVDGSTVTMAGPPVVFGGAIRYSFVGEFVRRGTFLFRLLERSSDGSERRYDGGLGEPDPAPVVFAGVDPPGGAADDGGDGGASPLLLAGVASIAAGVLGAGVLLLRRRADAAVTRRR